MFSLMRLWNEPLSVDVRLWRLRWTTDYFLTCSPRRFTAIQVASRQLTMFNIKDNHTKWYKTIKQQNGPRPMSILLWMTSVQQQTLTGASLFHPLFWKKYLTHSFLAATLETVLMTTFLFHLPWQPDTEQDWKGGANRRSTKPYATKMSENLLSFWSRINLWKLDQIPRCLVTLE